MSGQDVAGRRAKVAELTEQDVPVKEIAARLGVSRYSVMRDQRANRAAAAQERTAAQPSPHTGAHSDPASAHSAHTPEPVCAQPEDEVRTPAEDVRTPEGEVRTGVRTDQAQDVPDERTVRITGAACALPQVPAQPRAHPVMARLSDVVRRARQADLSGWNADQNRAHVLSALLDIAHLALRLEPLTASGARLSAAQLRRIARLLTTRADALEQHVAAL